MAKIVVIHGTPGAGKTTHSERLVKLSRADYPVFHISAGNRLRDIRTGVIQSTFGLEINNPSAPALLDHRIVNGVIFEYIEQHTRNSIVLVDGYPRFVDAIEPFIEAIKTGGHELLGCLNLSISLETCMARLSGRGVRRGERIGVDIDSVERRYFEHSTYTIEAVKALKEITRVIDIDAESHQEIVWESYLLAFQELAGNRQGY